MLVEVNSGELAELISGIVVSAAGFPAPEMRRIASAGYPGLSAVS